MMGRDDARCKMGSRDRRGRRKWRGKGKGKREMKTTERCGERTKKEVRERKRGIGETLKKEHIERQGARGDREKDGR